MGPPMLSTVLKAREAEELSHSCTESIIHPPISGSSQQSGGTPRLANLRHNLDFIETSRNARNSLSSAFQRLQVLHATLLELQRQHPPTHPLPSDPDMGPSHVALILSSGTQDQTADASSSGVDAWFGDALGDVLRDDGVPARLHQLRAETLNSPSNHVEPAVPRTSRSAISWRSLLDQEVERRSSQRSRESGTRSQVDRPAGRDAQLLPQPAFLGRMRHRSLGRAIPESQRPLEGFGEGAETLLGRTVAARQGAVEQASRNPRGSGPYRAHAGSTSARVLVREHSSNPSTWVIPPQRTIHPEARTFDSGGPALTSREAGRVLPQPPLNQVTNDHGGSVTIGSRRPHDNTSDRLYVVRRRLNASNVEEVTQISLDHLDLDSTFASSQIELIPSSRESTDQTPRVTIPRRQTTYSLVEDSTTLSSQALHHTTTLEAGQAETQGQNGEGSNNESTPTAHEGVTTNQNSLPPLPRDSRYSVILEATQTPLGGRQPWT